MEVINMELKQNEKATIFNHDVKKNFKHESEIMLTLDLSYPQISLQSVPGAEAHINQHYIQAANRFYHRAANSLLASAIAEYNESKKRGFPFRAYDCVMKYTVMMNAACTLSTYFDQYEYTGGAHGNTIRISDNWELQSGTEIKLNGLFPSGRDYKTELIAQIQIMAEQNYKNNPYIYFEDYKKLIATYFNPKSFYLTPDALCIYYGLYEIGPYASGIIVFELPYAEFNMQPPGCIHHT
jgi:hypothetical protein